MKQAETKNTTDKISRVAAKSLDKMELKKFRRPLQNSHIWHLGKNKADSARKFCKDSALSTHKRIHNTTVAFPVDPFDFHLFSTNASTETFIEEVAHYLTLPQPSNVYDGDYIYSIQVTTPLNITKSVRVDVIKSLVPVEFLFPVLRGYIAHELIYKLELQMLKSVLQELCRTASEFELTLYKANCRKNTRAKIRLEKAAADPI